MSESRPSQETALSDFCGSEKKPTEKDGTFCPTCGRADFKNSRGMKMHHKMAHGESIAGVQINCDNCDEEFRKSEAKLEHHNNHYCSIECRSNHQMKNRSPEFHPQYEGGKTEYDCTNCGGSVYRYPYTLYESENVFCEHDCWAEWMSGQSLPEAQERVKLECDYCGEEFEKRPHEVNESQRNYCSKECHLMNMAGTTHPQWCGGHIEYYGENWHQARQKVLKRDNYTCQYCGDAESDATLDVHHIIKLRKFEEKYNAPEWWEKGNDSSNLITLCKSCHNLWEGIPLRPQ